MTKEKDSHHVVIIGGGFGGLYAAKGLGKAPVRVTLVDKRNFHLFQPLLYQVATGGLSPGDICSPLRAVLKRLKNTTVLKAEAMGIGIRLAQKMTYCLRKAGVIELTGKRGRANLYRVAGK